MPLTLRSATPADIPTVLAFIRELAEYEREPDAVVATDALIHESLFGADAVAHGVIAEIDGVAVGFAVYFFNFSTWLGRRGLYLEDLYVRPGTRGQGVGRALLAHLANIAVQRGCGRMEWAVLDWNEPAIGFYRTLGAAPMDDWTVFRLTGPALSALAAAAG